MRAGNFNVKNVLTLSPELWVGILVDYHKPFIDAFKQLCELAAFDKGTKAWWFPISYLPHVKQLAREHKAAPDKALDDAHNVIQAELTRRTFIKVNTDADGALHPALAEAYAVLSLHPNAPRLFIEWAIYFKRIQAQQMSIPQTELLRAEEAYRTICGGV